MEDSISFDEDKTEEFKRALEIYIANPHAVEGQLGGCMLFEFEPEIPGIEEEPDRVVHELKENSSRLEMEKEFRAHFRKGGRLEPFSLRRKSVNKKSPKTDSFWDRLIFDGHSLSVNLGRSRRPKSKISLEENGRVLKIESSCENLGRRLFQNFDKWMNQKVEMDQKRGTQILLRSNRLVPLDDYYEKYNQLKGKYSDFLVAIWEGESTNPEKFIHEDLAIASYLCLLWRNEGGRNPVKKKFFADLGCGNGLLVYILEKEGYSGTGFDLRQRKIWAKYDLELDLKVQSIVPSTEPVFSDYAWLLGNHSDELTPWIPVMAAASDAKFFVLPCCPFEFHGKFQRTKGKSSLFREYLDYVREVGEGCGFVVEEDRLKIPSTKRVAFVGRSKDSSLGDVDLNEVVNGRSVKDGHDDVEPSLSKRPKVDFVPRPSEIVTKNCTKLDQSVKDSVIKSVVEKCLRESNPLSQKETGVDFLHKPSDLNWNRGGVVPLSELATEVIPSELLQKLKSECGGLQTLLRNHNYIFVVISGSVRLRCHALDTSSTGKRRQNNPNGKMVSKKKSNENRKKKPCWFFANHPQGCPIESADCDWSHGVDDV